MSKRELPPALKDCQSMVLFFAEQDYQGCYYPEDHPNLSTWTETHNHGVEDFIQKTIKQQELLIEKDSSVYSLNFIVNAVVKVLDSLLKSKYFINALKQRGYVNIKELSSEQKVLVKENVLLIVDKNRYGQTFEFVPGEMPSQLQSVAQGKAFLAQKIRPNSVLTGEDLKLYERERKRHSEAEKKRKETAQKKAETKKQKEIEKAKKLLEEAGELS